MHREIAAKLAALPPLAPVNVTRGTPSCKICRGRTRFFDVVDFNKYCVFGSFYDLGASGVFVPYFRCDSCGFLFTDFFADWSTEEFARFVYNDDYLKIDGEYVDVRPRTLATDMAERMRGCETARILDYGSGTGAFGRHMQEAGFAHVTSYDPFSSPSLPTGQFDIITCFEVIEHTPEPVEAMRDMRRWLAPGGCIIFSQTLQPHDIESQRGNWWYMAPRNGHVSTFTPRSLELVAEAHDMRFLMAGGPYAFVSQQPSDMARLALSRMTEHVFYMRLGAPSGDVENGEWHEKERSEAGLFRWSKASTLTWNAPEFLTAPCRLSVTVPVVNQSEPSFAESCRFQLFDQTVSAQFRDGELVGALSLEETPRPGAVLHLLTPEPRSPRATRNIPDDRNLGLAVLVSPA